MKRYSRSSIFAWLIVLGCCAGAFGQSPATSVYDASVNNQATVNECSAGEPVSLNGNVHFEYHFTTDNNSVNHFTVTAANNLTGAGQSSGTAYAANDSEEYKTNSSEPTADLTVELKSQLNSKSSTAPNLTLVQTLHISLDTSGNLSAEVKQNTTQCGN